MAVAIQIEGQTGSPAFATEFGRRMEVIVAALLRADRPLAAATVRSTVRAELAKPPSITGRRAVLLANSMATAYLRRFAPPPEWRLAGRNVAVGAGRADLLFTDGEAWFVDELKAARIRPDDEALTHQVERYQRASESYGEAFLGVRVALLRAPTQLLLFPAPQAYRTMPTGRAR